MLDGLEVLDGGVIGSLRLHGGRDGGVHIAAGDGTLLEEPLALFGGAVGDLEVGLGLIDVELRLLNFFWNGGAGGVDVGGLSGGDGAFGVEGAAFEVAVFESDEELAFADMGAALHVLGADGSADAGRDGGLGERSEDGVGGDLVGDGPDGGMLRLDGDGGVVRMRRRAAPFCSCDHCEEARRSDGDECDSVQPFLVYAMHWS